MAHPKTDIQESELLNPRYRLDNEGSLAVIAPAMSASVSELTECCSPLKPKQLFDCVEDNELFQPNFLENSIHVQWCLEVSPTNRFSEIQENRIALSGMLKTGHFLPVVLQSWA
jgi:hypothetical protein